MRYLKYTLSLLMGIIVFASCEKNDPIVFKAADQNVSFMSNTVSIFEGGAESVVPVSLAGIPGSNPVTVSFEFDNSAYGDKGAVEGVDFVLNGNKTITFEEGFGEYEIRIQAINDDIFTGDKAFDILFTDVGNTKPSIHNICNANVVDDEHPLKKWIGNYVVDAKSYGDPGNWDEAWGAVTISADPEAIDHLLIVGIAGGTVPVRAKFDTDALTVTIYAGSSIGDTYGYGEQLLYTGDGANWTIDFESNIVGTISEDGSIHIDNLVSYNSPGGWVWDIFDSYWTISVAGISQQIAAPDFIDKRR